MTRPRTPRLLSTIGGAIGLGLAPLPPALAQNPATVARPSRTAANATVTSPDLLVFQALLANPVTAPYRIATAIRGGQVVLSGVVGTKQIHDEAIRTAIATGFSVRDELKIDTAEAYRVAAGPAGTSAPYAAPSLGASPYIYPPPLFGRLDDPFFGFEPPILSYPPWWRAVNSREPTRLAVPTAPGMVPVSVQAAPIDPGAPAPNASPTGPSATPPDAIIEMTINSLGVAVLRGTVASLADRIAVGQKIAQAPGVTEVINLLNVGRAGSETPPPPPQPALLPLEKPAAAPNQPPAIDPDIQVRGLAAERADPTRRLTLALGRRPALAGLPIKVSVRDGVAYLSGSVPTLYEAMLAFRTAQQAPGVREVDDRLEFVVPDGERKNPLLQKGRPEDVEPYLAAQIRRQLGDLAHVDQVRLRGESLEIRGTLERAEDRPRLDAILRSMPILRGFHLEPEFVAE